MLGNEVSIVLEVFVKYKKVRVLCFYVVGYFFLKIVGNMVYGIYMEIICFLRYLIKIVIY